MTWFTTMYTPTPIGYVQKVLPKQYQRSFKAVTLPKEALKHEFRYSFQHLFKSATFQ